MKNICHDLTVGIPFHGGTKASQLEEAIQSILNQTLVAAKCHLIQNGTVPEKILLIAKGYEVSHPSEIEHIFVAKRGLAAALNQSIKQCTTRYYARMDSDDVALPHRFEMQIKYLEAHGDVNILGSWAKEFTSADGIEKALLKQMPTDPQEMKNWFHYRNPLIHSTVMFQTRVFDDIGYYDETYLTDQDLQLWGRAITNNETMANIPEALIYFRTDNIIGRRSHIKAVWRQAKARFSVRTWSIKYNFLKIGALSFRLMPEFVQRYGYKNFRSPGS